MDKRSQVVTLRTAETIENEAADWLTRLDGGTLTPAERRELRTWLARDAEHARALKSLAAIWSDMDILLNDIPAAAPQPVSPGRAASPAGATLPDRAMSPDRAISPGRATSPDRAVSPDRSASPGRTTSPDRSALPWAAWFHPKRTSFALAAVLVCTVSAVIWLLARPAPTETSFLVTSIGKQQAETFSDGSTAHLNTNSMLEVEYTKAARIVRLLQGEALFDVAHDPDRPFIVYAGDSQVLAIGTKFVVRLDSDNVIVTVTDGQVQLSKRTTSRGSEPPKQQEVILVSRGEEVKVDDKTPAPKPREVNTEELERRLSWLEGQLVFKNERLEQVIAEVSRYVPNRIVIEDPELRDVRISGRFEIGDTEALLEAIEVSFNVKASHVDDQSIRLSR